MALLTSKRREIAAGPACALAWVAPAPIAILAEFHNAFEMRRTLIERSVFDKVPWRF